MNDTSLLDQLLSIWEARRAAGVEADAAELAADSPELVSPLRERIALLKAFETHSAPDSTPPNGQRTLLQNYTVLEEHARGGLGIVSRAHDEVLGRTVAIKTMLGPAFPTRVARFVREATITGVLDHPGVAPVLALSAEGRPWFAMRFIRGVTLAEAIRKHHESPTPAGLRQLLGRFQQVCNTVAYAHHTGIIHRDLKPANVMLGDFGETIVLDWGLAKWIDDADGEPTPPASGPEITSDGASLGTPAYMSPEQARGEMATVGPASDVYSLGATLAVILTGYPPVQHGDVATVIDRVARGVIGVDAGPMPLRAVALKAMSLNPANRYPTPLDLAKEIEHWLADEPLEAYRGTWPERMSRWNRRNRGPLRAVVSLVLTIAVAATIAAVLLGRSAERERGMKVLAEQREQEAAENFRQARQTVDDYFVTVSESRIGMLPGGQPLKRELLQKALSYYQQFVQNHGQSPDRQSLAATLSKIALIQGELGESEAALSSHRAAVTLWRTLAAEVPDSDSLDRQLAGSLDLMSLELARQKKWDDAEACAAEACQKLETHFQKRRDPALYGYLSRALVNYALCLGQQGKTAVAIDVNRRGIALDTAMVEQSPQPALSLLNLSKKHNNLGVDLTDAFRFEDARVAFRDAAGCLERCEQLLAADPSQLAGFNNANSNPRKQRGLNALNAGYVELFLNEVAAANTLFESANATFDELQSADAAVKEYHYPRRFAAAHGVLALWLLDPKAPGLSAKAQALRTAATAGSPDLIPLTNALVAAIDGEATAKTTAEVTLSQVTELPPVARSLVHMVLATVDQNHAELARRLNPDSKLIQQRCPK